MRKVKIGLLISLIALFSTVFFAACTKDFVQLDPDEYHDVIFYHNGGAVNSDSYTVQKVPHGNILPRYDSSSPITEPKQANFDFDGWYLASQPLKMEERPIIKEFRPDGTPVYHTDENGRQVNTKVYYVDGHDFTNINLTGERAEEPLTFSSDNVAEVLRGEVNEAGDFVPYLWNFDLNRVTAPMYFVAMWKSQRKFVMISNSDQANLDYDAENYAEIQSQSNNTMPPLEGLTTDGAVVIYGGRNTSLAERKDGLQIEGFYYDAEFTQPIRLVNSKFYPEPEYVEGTTRYKVTKIFVKYISNVYTIIESINSFSPQGDLVAIGGSSRLYLMNDIDFSGYQIVPPDVFNGEINGRGFAFTNVTRRIKRKLQPYTADNAVYYGGLFDSIGAAAVISDFSVKGMDIIFTDADPASRENLNSIYWNIPVIINPFAADIKSTARITNVSFGAKNANEIDDFGVTVYLEHYHGTEFLREDYTDQNGFLEFYGLAYGELSAEHPVNVLDGKYVGKYLDINEVERDIVLTSEQIEGVYTELIDGIETPINRRSTLTNKNNLTYYKDSYPTPKATFIKGRVPAEGAEEGYNYIDIVTGDKFGYSSANITNSFSQAELVLDWTPPWEITIDADGDNEAPMQEPPKPASDAAISFKFEGWATTYLYATYTIDGIDYKIYKTKQWTFTEEDFVLELDSDDPLLTPGFIGDEENGGQTVTLFAIWTIIS